MEKNIQKERKSKREVKKPYMLRNASEERQMEDECRKVEPNKRKVTRREASAKEEKERKRKKRYSQYHVFLFSLDEEV